MDKPVIGNPGPPTTSNIGLQAQIHDFAIECSPEDASHFNFKEIQMVIMGSNNEDNGGSLERISQTRWEYRGVIELYPDIGELAFIVRSEDGGDIGYLTLTKEEVKQYGRTVSSTGMQNGEHKFVMEADTPALLLKFAISGMRQDQEVPISVPSIEDSSFWLDKGDAVIRPLLEEGALAEVCKAAIGCPLEDFLHRFGVGFKNRFEQTGNLDDISKAIEYQQRAVVLTAENHADMPSRLNKLGNSFKSRFERTGGPDDISNAIDYHLHAVALTPEGHVDMPSRLNSLGISFLHRFEQRGTLDDIFKAIESQKRAIALTPKGHADMSAWLNNLGNSFLRSFDRTGNLDDISKAIEYQQRAIELIHEGHANMPTLLNNLGSSFNTRFKHTGDLDDISNAIEYHQRAVALTHEDHADMPSRLSNLGNSFFHRNNHTDNLEDITKAIQYYRSAIALTHEGDLIRPLLLNNLGTSYLCRFERGDNTDDISKAIEYQQHAVALVHEGHADMPSRLSNLGTSFSRLFKRTGNLNDISKAIEYQQRAVELIPEGHANMPPLLNNLGSSLSSRFEQSSNLEDISKAIECRRHTVALTPENHADMPVWRKNLGSSLMKRFQQTSALEDCKAAVLNFHLAATQLSGSPSDRFEAARCWARSSVELGDLEQTLQAYTVAVELLSLVASLDQTIQNRHNNLVKISDFTPLAVLVAILAGRTSTALEWLEQGRCLVWAQLNQLRTPVDKLRAYDTPLADRFLIVSKALESSGSRPELSTTAKMTITHQMNIEDQVRTHLKLAQEWNDILARIRGIPDFRDFLQPHKAATILSQLPPEGPIIIINVCTNRCDALALIYGTDKVLHIPLNNFTFQEVDSLRRDLRSYLASNGLLMRDDRAGRPSCNATNSSPLRRILRILWKGFVKPILDALGYCSMSPRRNRIWWCPTGPLASLPIHAAGIYGREATAPGMCISDYALSSYIPTVNTLLEKLRRSAQASQSNTDILLVSQPNTPGLPRISGTTTETQAILNGMTENGIRAIRLEGEEAKVRRVEEELRSHQWVHFACHASQNPIDPLKSGFYLHDGQLELIGLIRQKLPTANFAFLSACQTSVGDEKLSDEVVHLAAGMLAAGYQGVVGTMWSIEDRCAPKIAEEFYGHLLKERKKSGSCGLNSSGAAYALDHAIRKIRDGLPDYDHSFLTWVPYVHYGL